MREFSTVTLAVIVVQSATGGRHGAEEACKLSRHWSLILEVYSAYRWIVAGLLTPQGGISLIDRALDSTTGKPPGTAA